MVVFRKVIEAEIGSSPISLAVMENEDGLIVGRIMVDGIEQMFKTAPYDPPIAEAISVASRLAVTNNVEVNVYDPENRWQREWGVLF